MDSARVRHIRWGTTAQKTGAREFRNAGLCGLPSNADSRMVEENLLTGPRDSRINPGSAGFRG